MKCTQGVEGKLRLPAEYKGDASAANDSSVEELPHTLAEAIASYESNQGGNLPVPSTYDCTWLIGTNTSCAEGAGLRRWATKVHVVLKGVFSCSVPASDGGRGGHADVHCLPGCKAPGE